MDNQGSQPGGARVCPASHGKWLATPLRKLFHNPDKILSPFVNRGDTVVDLGCGPGYFTIPMARLVGDDGCVIAVDLQQGMLDLLNANAARENLSARIRPHLSSEDSIGVTEPADFVLAFYMVHEVPDAKSFISEIRGFMKPGGRFLLVEPKFHVSAAGFARTTAIDDELGMRRLAEPRIVISRSVLFARE